MHDFLDLFLDAWVIVCIAFGLALLVFKVFKLPRWDWLKSLARFGFWGTAWVLAVFMVGGMLQTQSFMYEFPGGPTIKYPKEVWVKIGEGPPVEPPPVQVPSGGKTHAALRNPRNFASIIALEQGMKNLTGGKLSFDIPPKMKQGEVTKAQVRISKSTTDEMVKELKDNMNATVVVEDIEIAPFMIVELHPTNKSAFTIEPLTNANQPVTDAGFTTWAWSVTPLDYGKQKLFLSIGTRFKLPNSAEETKFVPFRERTIDVEVSPMFAAAQFAQAHVEFTYGIVAGAAAAIGGFIYKLYSKWRELRRTTLEP